MIERSDEFFMKQALREANKAFEADEVPVGAVVVMNERVIARGYNMVEKLNDSTAHAEMIALTSAFEYLGSKYLPEATVYVTVEPCNMCSGALYWSKVNKVVFGATDLKHGAMSLNSKPPFHPKTQVIRGVLEEECTFLMKEFFRCKR